MTNPDHEPESIKALFKPLPELDGSAFTQSVLVRTKRIQIWRNIMRRLTYLSVPAALAVCAVALPWQVLLTRFNSLTDSMTSQAEPIAQISTLTQWLQTTMNIPDFQVPQIVLIAALASLLGSVITALSTDD